MVTIQSNSINKIKNEEYDTKFYDFPLSTWARSKKEPKVVELHPQSSLMYPYKYFLQNGCECEIINFTTPLKSLFVGDTIEIILPEYGIPTAHGNTLFVITRVNFIYKEKYAVCDIEARRWNY